MLLQVLPLAVLLVLCVSLLLAFMGLGPANVWYSIIAACLTYVVLDISMFVRSRRREMVSPTRSRSGLCLYIVWAGPKQV